MADLAYLNSDEGIRRICDLLMPAFSERFDRLISEAQARGACPSTAEVLSVMGCSRDEFAALLAILQAKARMDGATLDVEIFGIEVDVTAVLHHDRAAGVTHWILKPWSNEGLMLT